ncbi:MAG: hypothetical protein A2086_08035 [Spirochaetes bacterium GWD1_27_9]|nr:MAG: hypothetical protein A2Y34_16825 [Spirochaetes bacterium GWC1_27_15]OHD34471.1 MAG: hypothetical protein A2086_08035 [Spirochaetes bacterium GWD1_27_9]
MNLIKESFNFFKELFGKKYMIYQLVKNDLKIKYLGSHLGIIWAFIMPFVMVFVMRFVLQKGLKVGNMDGIPFLAWLIPGQAAWTFFNEALVTSTNTYIEYAYLVKKVNFRISILPLVKILSALFIHFLFLLVVLIILFFSKIPFSIYWFQVFYYVFALSLFVLGLSWITASLNVFVKDVLPVIVVILNFGMWLTPVFWNYKTLENKTIKMIVMLNPLTYIMDGYRKCFLYKTPFWNDGIWMVYFWGLTVLFMLVGVFLFKKLKPHFADVL